MVKELWHAIGGAAADLDRLATTGSGALESAFPVSDLAAASVGVAALSVSELLRQTLNLSSTVQLDRRLASFWFQSSIRPIHWSIPQPWDAIAGDYLASDGWIRLHTNAPHHRLAAERVLGAGGTKDNVAKAVASWTKGDLEAAIVEAGGCAAEMRSLEEWQSHPQGIAVASEKLADIDESRRCSSSNWLPKPERPLAGIKILDLTRVLAGPVATRFLAGYGADVLRIDPPDWDEPGVVPDVTLGKGVRGLTYEPKSTERFSSVYWLKPMSFSTGIDQEPSTPLGITPKLGIKYLPMSSTSPSARIDGRDRGLRGEVLTAWSR